MNSLSKYITEKLHLNKDIKRTLLPQITDSDEVFVHNYMNKSNAQQSSVANRLKNKDIALRRYIAGLKVSDSSIPKILNGEVYSQPSNFFKYFGNRALELGYTIEDMQELYEYSSHIKPNKLLKSYNNVYFDFLRGILPNIHRKPNGIYEFDSEEDEPKYNNEWSDSLIETANKKMKGNSLLLHSYIVKINGKEHIIENISTPGGAIYFGFWIDGKKYNTHNDFKEAMSNL